MKRKQHKSRNPMIAVLAAPIFKQKGHGKSAKIYNRKKIAGKRHPGDYFLRAA